MITYLGALVRALFRDNCLLFFRRCLRFTLILGALLLTGCLQYDLDIQFDSQTHGQLVQQFYWRGSATAAQSVSEPWLEVLTERLLAVGGQSRFLADGKLEVTVPFNNGKDLEARFNQFFSPPDKTLPLVLPGKTPIQAKLSIAQVNRFLAIHNHINLLIDLTAVPDLTNTALPLLQQVQLFNGAITLTVPWNLRSPTEEGSSKKNWSLVPGQVNQFEADFWVPSPIGIGACAIALLVALGYGLKYGILKKSTP